MSSPHEFPQPAPPSGQRPSRRGVLRALAGGILGASAVEAASADPASAPTPSPASTANPDAASWPIWKLERPQALLPSSYFWTWDHSTNWMLDDPGLLNFGCDNRYLKQPATYVEDYRRLTDLAAGLGIKGILIWGFLRDAHGGIDSAKRVADYAAARGVAIKPGVGTNWYGGIYYEGNHQYNLETFIRKHPDARSVDERGQPRDRGLCPLHPRFVEWLQEGLRWLFREFAVGGANLENGDFLVCHCPRCRRHRDSWPKDEPDFWRNQFLGYDPALRAIEDQLKKKLVTWATYKGFVPGSGQAQRHAYMECPKPALLGRLPSEGVCQWTLTHMVRPEALPLKTFLDDGVPRDALANEVWPAALRPPTRRSVGFLHQGSQWSRVPRYRQIISTIKEGCLRAYRAGLEGVSIHGEVSSMYVPWALNYLAFSHFTHWPEDSLRQLGRKTLGQVLNSPDEGEAFIELLVSWDAGALSDAQRKDLLQRNRGLAAEVARGKHLQRWRLWNWLAAMARGKPESHTASMF